MPDLSSPRPAAAAPWQPKDPDYAGRVRASFARQGAMRTLGAELLDVAPGYCAIALVPRPEVAQQHGYVHAGVVAAIVDSAGGYAGIHAVSGRRLGADRRVQAQPDESRAEASASWPRASS